MKEIHYLNIWKPIETNRYGDIIKTDMFRLPLCRLASESSKPNYTTMDNFLINKYTSGEQILIRTKPSIFSIKCASYVKELLEMIEYRSDITFIIELVELTSINNSIKYNNIKLPNNLKIRLILERLNLNVILRNFFCCDILDINREIQLHNASESNIKQNIEELPEVLMDGRINKILFSGSYTDLINVSSIEIIRDICKSYNVEFDILELGYNVLKNNKLYLLNPVESITQAKKSNLSFKRDEYEI